MTLPERIRGVVRRPRATFEALARRPTWLAVVVASTIASGAAWGSVFSTQTGRLALVDQWERTALAVGRAVGDEEYAAFQQWSQQGVLYATGRAIATGPGLAALVGGLIYVATRRRQPTGDGHEKSGNLLPAPPRLAQCLAVSAHAGVILTLRDLVAAPLAFARETTASTTTLGSWFSFLDETTPAARLLGSIDGFILWWVLVLAIGTSVLTGRRPRSYALTYVSVYLAVAVAAATTIVLAGRL